MAKITLEEQPDFLVFPPDTILELKIEECSVQTFTGPRGPFDKLAFKFKILGIQAVGDGSPVEKYEEMITETIFGSVPFKFTDNPENRLRQWAEAIFRQELAVGFELDTDLFEGRTVRGLTSTYIPKARAGETSRGPRHQVESLLPIGKVQLSAQVPEAPPVAVGANPWGDNQAEEPPF